MYNYLRKKIINFAGRIDDLKTGFSSSWYNKLDKNVEGWCSIESSKCLWKLAQMNKKLGVIVEIGSAWGKSTIILAEASKKAELSPVFSVDPNTGGVGYLEQLGVNKIDSYSVFSKNLIDFKVTDWVIPIVDTSLNASQNWDSCQSIRLLYIDGWHTSEGVSIDINSWFPFVPKGGIIVFDDYFQPTLKDYKKTIDDLLPNHNVKLPLKKISPELVMTYKL